MAFLSAPGLRAPAACYLSDPQRENGSRRCELLAEDRSWNLWLQEKHKDKVWVGGLRREGVDRTNAVGHEPRRREGEVGDRVLLCVCVPLP